MVVAERIRVHVQKLPELLQAEVLDFVEFLLLKVERESTEQDEIGWPNFSLTMAMRGMEDEDTPTYTTADLRVVFT
jgi:hypothetical protein